MGFEISYQHQETQCRGYYAIPDQMNSPRPLVLIAHDWSGLNAFSRQKADEMAALGYVGFAMDLYGQGRVGQSNEEKNQLMQPLFQDRIFLQDRVQAALQAACDLPQVDFKKIAAIGFCFGGLAVLDLAHSGAPISGVVSFHGLLIPPPAALRKSIQASLLILHGDADPMVKPDAVRAYADDLSHVQADWQIHSYGNTLHAFTNPQANDPDFGTVYQARACQRSMQAMQDFLKEKFNECII